MYIASRTDLEAVTYLVRKLETGGRHGIALSALAAGAPVTTVRLEKLLEKNPEYFVRVGSESSFTLNRFGMSSQSGDKVVSEIERSFHKGRRQQLASIVAVGVTTIMCVIAIVRLK